MAHAETHQVLHRLNARLTDIFLDFCLFHLYPCPIRQSTIISIPATFCTGRSLKVLLLTYVLETANLYMTKLTCFDRVSEIP